MIDISDGLSSDLSHILVESGGLGAVLDETAIPIHKDAREMTRFDAASALDHALHDGEDFELCIVMPATDAARLLADPPPPAKLFRVGEITDSPGIRLRSASGEIRPIPPRGFDHFRKDS
jgi:thiamine-monophosphate kinase